MRSRRCSISGRRAIRLCSGGSRRSSLACGATAIAALLAYARRFDGLDGPIEVSRREIDKSATLVDSNVRKAIALAARNIRTVAEKQRPRAWTVTPVPGVRIRQRVLPLDRVGCYVPGGPLSPALLAADDRDSGARGRRAGRHRRLPEA